MNSNEYKMEFESKIEDLDRILNVISDMLSNDELNEYATNIKPAFTILEE